MKYHVPALLHECIEGLNIQPSGIYVDVTFGGGGHSKAILEKLDKGSLIAFDQDADAEKNCPPNPNFIFLNQNFRFLKANMRHLGFNEIDGLIADLGVSFHQFDEPGRGFSFRFDAPLDMRMNRYLGQTAADILNIYDREDLKRIFRDYGEIKNAGALAGAIVKQRDIKPYADNRDLIAVLVKFAVRGRENKFYAKVFQSLRIELNREIDFLKEMLAQAGDMLRTGGRLVVITYHSLEDRVVKNFMRTGNFEGNIEKDFYGNEITPFRLVNRKAIVPSAEEIEINSRARSARLRIAEKI